MFLLPFFVKRDCDNLMFLSHQVAAVIVLVSWHINLEGCVAKHKKKPLNRFKYQYDFSNLVRILKSNNKASRGHWQHAGILNHLLVTCRALRSNREILSTCKAHSNIGKSRKVAHGLPHV